MIVGQDRTEIKYKKRIQFTGERKSDFMPKETIRKLLQKLDRFEKSEIYLKNNYTLQKLSIFCGTNTKYMSCIINSYKRKDYNNYINDLRIQYILAKLENDQSYRKFKISVLAHEAGFSSPNKFSYIFKNNKGILPSKFIKNLQ